MKIAHLVLAFLILILGEIHTSMTFTCKVLNEDALWVAGSGIAILFAGLFNLLVVLTSDKLAHIITLLVNLLIASLFCFATMVLTGAQVYVGIALFILATLLTYMKGLKRSNRIL